MKRTIKKSAFPLLFFALGATLWWFSPARKSQDDRASLVIPVGDDQTTSGSTTLVRIGNRVVTKDDLLWEEKNSIDGLRNDAAHTEAPTLPVEKEFINSEVRRFFLSVLVERALLISALERQKNLVPTVQERLKTCSENAPPFEEIAPEDQPRFKKRYCEQSVIQSYFNETFRRELQVSEKEKQQYFEKNRKTLAVPERVHVRQIVLATEKTAKEVRSKVRRDNFSDLARQHSITPEGQKGGKLNPFARGDLPQSFHVAFSMQPGQISDIVKSPYGFHILLLDRREPAHEARYDELAQEVEKRLAEEKKKEVFRSWVNASFNRVAIKPP